MAHEKVDLGPVQETLLIPLFGRAVETARPHGLIRDPKAADIVALIDYDFDKLRRTRTPVGTCLRTHLFDDEVREFLRAQPEGTVVEIGCGLNTRFERLDNGRARWFELDLPDSIELRRRFFEDSPRRTMIAASVLDESWLETVAQTGGPWCFVAEAVLIYFEEADVRRVVERLVRRFPGSILVADTTSTRVVDGRAWCEARRYLPKGVWFRWKCDDPARLAEWGLKLVRSRDFTEVSDDIKARLPLAMRLFARWLPWLMKRKLAGYRINRFEL